MVLTKHSVRITGDVDLKLKRVRRPQKTDIVEVLSKAIEHGIDSIKTENLYTFDGVRGYSLGQGQ
jgi:hypothetical protein